LPFGQDVLVWCVTVPVILSLLAATFARVCEAKRVGVGLFGGELISGLGWCLALLVALAARRQWQWMPEEFWQTAWWAMLAAAVLLSNQREISVRHPLRGTRPSGALHKRYRTLISRTILSRAADKKLANHSPASRWVVAGLLAMFLAWLALPSDESWQDMFPFHRNWMAAVSASALVNAWAMDQHARSGGRRWSLWIVIAGLGGPFALAAATYGALSEWTLAAIASTIVFAIVGSFSAAVSSWSVAFPALFFHASMTAAARFYSYEEYPAWMYAVVLFSPTVVVMADLPLRNQTARRRILSSAMIAAMLLGLCIWQIL